MDEKTLLPKIEEGFLGKTPVDFLNYLLLQQIDEAQRAYMDLSRLRAHNVEIAPINFRTKLRGLYVKCMFGLRRWDPKEERQHRAAVIEKEQPTDQELFSAFEFMLEWLDTIRVTRVDTRKKYDRSNWEADNEASNL